MSCVSILCVLSGCDTPEKRTLRALSQEGIQPSGRALVEAVTLDKRQHVRWLLDIHVHTEQRDDKGRTPLRIAIEEGRPALALMLLEADADPNARGADGVDILGVAIGKRDAAMFGKLIESGAKPDGVMPGGEKILTWCIRNGHVAFVRLMFEHGADPHITDHEGDPLIHIAVKTGNQELVRTLIEEGADPAAIDSEGHGILSFALQNGWTGILSDLTAAGADPNLPSPEGLTLLEQAIEDRDADLIPILMRIGADPVRVPTRPGGVTPLEAAVASGHPPTLRAVLREGEMLDGPEWEPALWLAFEKDNFELANMLLRRGARANRHAPSGLLLVENATIHKRIDWLKLLLDFGHDTGKSIYYAASRNDRMTAGFLLACGAGADFTPVPSTDTALSVAIRSGHDRLAALLLRHGADPNINLPGNQKPLHFAIVKENPETVRELLSAGADPNEAVTRPVSDEFLEHVKSKNMRWYLVETRNITPLMLAANTGNLATARHLLEAGAETNTYTRPLHTWPLNFASRRNDVPMMRLILGQDPHKRERHIVLSIGEQRARVYDAKGDEIFSTKVSTGKSGYSTRQGEFVITDKHRHHNSTIYESSMPYFQRLSCSDFGFHYGYVPNYPASHGCIRVPMDAAKQLFSMTKVGDTVSIIP